MNDVSDTPATMPPLHEPTQFFSRHFVVSLDDEFISISYELSPSMTLGSAIREKDLRQKLKSRLKRWHPAGKFLVGNIFAARFNINDNYNARFAVDDLDRMLDSFANEKLTPKMVEEVLGITALERVRWNKDGRLPKSGTGTFRKGRQLFQFLLHPAAGIAKIAANPSVIAEWRKADASACNTAGRN